MGDDEEEEGTEFIPSDDVIAQYQTTRIRAFWTGYKRIFQLTNHAAMTLDPSKFTVTNTFPYQSIVDVTTDDKNTDQFSMIIDRTTYVYKTAHRSQLLCQLFECISKYNTSKFKVYGPIRAQRVRKNGSRVNCEFSVAPYGIIEIDSTERVLQEYRWVNINRLGTDDSNNTFFLDYSGRTKIFFIEDIDLIVKSSQAQLRLLGMTTVSFLRNQDSQAIITYRHSKYTSIPAAVSIFDVSKFTKRSIRPMPRQLHISEDYILEKDASGFQSVSFQRVDAIYAIVRSWNNPREFTIEYNDGSSRTFTSSIRDTLLAMLMDVCHAAGNVRVIVTGEVSDGLRLMPRFAEEEYVRSIKDTFFGASSIEAWFLTRLSKACRKSPLDFSAIERACRELNANVPCPGITPTSDSSLVKSALSGVLRCINTALLNSYNDERKDYSRSIAIMLQTLYRIIPSTAGYKAFVEVKEIDARQLMLQLLKFNHDFVNYWALEVMMTLCRCPLMPRNTQQEFINKHTLLTDKMLLCLIDLMAFRTAEDLEDSEEDEDEEDPENAEVEETDDKFEKLNPDQERASGDSSKANDAKPVTEIKKENTPSTSFAAPSPKAEEKKAVAANPSTTAHIPIESHKSARVKDLDGLEPSNDDEIINPENAEGANAADFVNFTPNSLVVIGAAALLESIVSSKRDTSSPELLNQVLDIMADRCEVLISMLRSTSFIIMENAAILMFTLIKNRPVVGPLLKELALSECLVLKHFYNAVFSPSATQRFISRFLIATWMTGSPKINHAKALLLRMIPSGLAEYLKFAAITEEHRKNLDTMEDEFYASFSNAGSRGSLRTTAAGSGSGSSSANNIQARMRKRITSALREQLVEKVVHQQLHSSTVTTTQDNTDSSNSGTENRSMDSVMTDKLNAVTVKPVAHTALSAPSLNAAAPTAPSPSPKQPENYRIMFHVMTQDHKLPDLIWNEHTRLELRSTLEAEFKDFEREQRLLGSRKIAWNYQQFSVVYESLRDELQVGPIYVRYFLDAGPTFLRSLENPSHVVLFEKLFRRIMVNVQRNPPLSILCAKCLVRLYDVCKDIVGGFDDMLIIVRMLEQACNMELQHCLLDLMVSLAAEESNLLQLLDKSFVNVIIKYVSLAHINPDQIGNVLARATTNVLMIKDADNSTGGYDIPSGTPMPGSAAAEAVSGSNFDVSITPPLSEEKTEEEISRQLKRSMWVPDDIACPKVWFAAPKGQFPPPKNIQRGPFRVSELLTEFDRGSIDDSFLVAPIPSEESYDNERFDAIVDTGRWRPISDFFQLRMQMLFPGKAVYSPAEVATKGLTLLTRLAAVHRAANVKGVPFYPIPMSKRIMSDRDHLVIFSQLLLSNDGSVVEVAANLLRSLVEYNSKTNSKLYLTGAFFFACRYTGNNFFPLAKLFHATHLRQSFHDSAASVARELRIAQRSVLGTMLPQAMVQMLHNYGPERFSIIFTGDFDTPEVIWNADLRKHMVEMIEQHLGDFPARLRQFSLAEYDYCPIPKVHYESLDRDIYVHEYYLRNLCDEVRFPEWPIGAPLHLLRETIERWRVEMSKGIVDSSVRDAKKLLELPDKFENADLRKAYKNLARKYHPDKNPDGRDMFEKIHVAYELLSSIELQVVETDMINVMLLIKTQNIVYRRFPQKIADQKYPAYPLLLQNLNPPASGTQLNHIDAEILRAGTMLMFYTTNVSPLNAAEFIKAGCVDRLYEIIRFAMSISYGGETRDLSADLLVFGLKTLTSVANMDIGRANILKLCPGFAEEMYTILTLDKQMPLAVENCLEVIARCSSCTELQNAFVNAGVIWRLVPFLLGFDNTVNDDYSDENQRSTYNQIASNMHAIVGAKTLGRLGGYMYDDLASPKNDQVQDALSELLTQPLARLLRNRRPWDLLNALNENVEKTTKIWNVGMRTELLDFVQKIDKNRTPGSSDTDLAAASSFQFSSLREELCVGGVYVRIFNKTSETLDIDDPSKFCRALIKYIWSRICPVDDPERFKLELKALGNVHLEYAVEGLRVLAEAQSYVAHDIATCRHGIDTVFLLLDQPSEGATFGSAAQALSILCANSEFISEVTKYNPPCIWRLLRCLCTVESAHVTHAWAAAEGLASHPEGLTALMDAGAVVQILGTLLAVKGYANAYNSRLAAISLLSKFLWNPVKGSEASAMLRRFLPEPVVLLLRSKAGNASLHVLDTVCENPELIWTKEMQSELRESIALLLNESKSTTTAEEGSNPISNGFETPPKITVDYYVKYRQLESEIYVGGVYIRLYLKQPTFRLTNPILFVEKLVEFWESAFHIQVPANMKKGGKVADSFQGTSSDSRALVLGSEDFLALLTSCLVCIIKAEHTVVEHLLSWGFIHTLCELLKRCITAGRTGSPLVSIVRLLHQLVGKVEVVDNIACAKDDIVDSLKQSLEPIGEPEKLPRDAALVIELLKRIYKTEFCRFMGHFVQMAMNTKLPQFVLDKILGASESSSSAVLNPSALRIHAVDLLKALVAAADEETAGVIQAMLDLHPSWKEYRNQSHDLFLTDKEKTDVYLIQDSTDTKFAGLLTDGSVSTSISQFFTSSGIPPAHSNAGSSSSTDLSNPFAPKPPQAPQPATEATVEEERSKSRPKSVNLGTSTIDSNTVAKNVQRSSVPNASTIQPTNVKSTQKRIVTGVVKGDKGIGLDLEKSKPNGLAQVLRFKVFPDGTMNPATRCDPPILPGDVIVGVNGSVCNSFNEAVKLIRSIAVGDTVQLALERSCET